MARIINWCERHEAMDVGFHVPEGVCTEFVRLEGTRNLGAPSRSNNCRMVKRALVDLDRLPSRSIEAAAKELWQVAKKPKWSLRAAAEAAIRAFLTDLEQGEQE